MKAARGGNLDVIRGMNSESVDLICAAPPFNSDKKLRGARIGSEAAWAAFKDAWTLSDIDVAWLGMPGPVAVLDTSYGVSDW